MKTYNENISCMRWYIIAIMSSILLVCCNDEYDKNSGKVPSISRHYLKPSSTNFEFESSKSIKELFITSEGVEWSLSNHASWIGITPNKGNESSIVDISVEENLSGDTSRVSIIELESNMNDWNYSRAISISQSTAKSYLNLSQTAIQYGGVAETKEISVSSNCSWTIQYKCDWLKVNRISDKLISISTLDNPTNDYRKSSVTLSYKGGNKNIEIVQYPANITTSQTYVQCEKEAASFSLHIESEMNWEATTSDSWIQITPSNGNAGDTDIEIAITPNNAIESRKGYVTIYIQQHQRVQIEIAQRGIYLEMVQTTLNFSSGIETQQLQLNSNASWKVTELPQWITLSAMSGDGSQIIDVVSTNNNSTMPRSGILKFELADVNLSCQASVHQAEKKFNINATVLEFGVEKSALPVGLTSELPWTSTISDGWISVNPSEGNGSATVNVSVDETQSYEERTGEVIFSVIDKDLTVNVHQLAKYFQMKDYSAFDFTSKGGTANVSFFTNEAWSACVENDEEWVVLSDTVGKGNGQIFITIKDNPSSKSRQTTVQIKKSTGQYVNILIKQAARYLKTDVQSFSFFASANEAIFHVESDGNYEVNSPESWISLQNIRSNQWEVAVSQNPEAIVRKGNIIVKLTDLVDSLISIEIPVTQTYEGGVYIDKMFTEELDWNVSNDKELKVSIKSYSTEKGWDSMKKDSIKISKTEFQDENKYNSSVKDTVSVDVNEYNDDDIFDVSKGDSINVNKDSFEGENGYNSTKGDTVIINKNDYSENKGFDSALKDSLNIKKDEYGKEETLDASKIDTIGIKKTNYGKDKEWN